MSRPNNFTPQHARPAVPPSATHPRGFNWPATDSDGTTYAPPAQQCAPTEDSSRAAQRYAQSAISAVIIFRNSPRHLRRMACAWAALRQRTQDIAPALAMPATQAYTSRRDSELQPVNHSVAQFERLWPL